METFASPTKRCEQIFALEFSVAIKWLISCIKATKYHNTAKDGDEKYQNLQSVCNYAVNITIFSPETFFLIFVIYCW